MPPAKKIVHIPDYGNLEFDSSVPDDQIREIVAQSFKTKEAQKAFIAPQATGPIDLPKAPRGMVQTDPINRGLTSLYANLPTPKEALMGMVMASPIGSGIRGIDGLLNGPPKNFEEAMAPNLPIDAKALGEELGNGDYASAAGRTGAAAFQMFLMKKAFDGISPKTFPKPQVGESVFSPQLKGLQGDGIEAQVRAAGAHPVGVQRGMPEAGLPDLFLFNDPQSMTTLALPMNTPITSQAVAAKLAASRRNFMPTRPDFSVRR